MRHEGFTSLFKKKSEARGTTRSSGAEALKRLMEIENHTYHTDHRR